MQIRTMTPQRAAGAATPARQAPPPSSPQAESSSPTDSAVIRAPGMDVSTKNGLVSAAGGLLTQAVWATGAVPGGALGQFVSGVATFAVTKGVYHGIQEVRARAAKGMPTEGAFKAGFKYYAKANVLRGLLHTSIQSMSSMLGSPAGFIAGPVVSGALTKLTGY